MGTFMGSPRRERATPAHMATFPATFPGTVAEHTHHTKMHQHVCREALKAEEEEEGPSAWLSTAEQAGYMFEIKTACAL